MSIILFISPQPLFGGAAVANMSIAKMLQDDGNVVVYNDEYMEADEFNGLRIYHYNIHAAKANRSANLLNIIDEINKTIGTLDSIIWGDVSIFIYFQSALKKIKKSGIRQMAIFHSLSLENNIKSKILETVVSYSISFFDYYIFVSDYTRKSWSKYWFIRRNPSKLKVIFNPVRKEKPRHQIRNADRLSLGFVGRFSEEKQPGVFCALSKSPSYNLVTYGEGPLLAPLKEQYAGVCFKGLCNDTNTIYNDIDVLVLTSKFENCPMVILEAKTRGIPCVAPNVGGIPEIVSNGYDGVLYTDYDTAEILKAIDIVVSKYSVFSNNCLAKAEITYPTTLVKKWREIL
jgi:glycosyltransferase involved in cell wall biosynthesis